MLGTLAWTVARAFAFFLLPLAVLGAAADAAFRRRGGKWRMMADALWVAVITSALVGFGLIMTSTIHHASALAILGGALYVAFFYWWGMGAWRRTSWGRRSLAARARTGATRDN